MTQLCCQFCRSRLELTENFCRDREDIHIGRCTKCSLVQVDDFGHITEQWYAADDYWSDLEAARQRERIWNQKRIRLLLQYVQGITDATILDYGSGHGGLLQAGQRVFRNLTGFDLSRRVCRAHEALGWRCVNSLDEIPHDVEVILLFHVLEHLLKPWECLAELKHRFLNANTFVLEVPNTDEALNTVFKSEAYLKNHFGVEHLYYFTPKTLKMVVEAAGLKIVTSTQLQRYTLANNIGWLIDKKGSGQDRWEPFNDARLNEEYERILIANGIADSIFMICHSVKR